MKRWIHCNADTRTTEEILEEILQILDDDYYWGAGCDDVYMELHSNDSITESDLRRAMDTAVGYEGLSSDELIVAYEDNKKAAHDIAERLGLAK